MTNGDMGWLLCQEVMASIAREYRWPLAPDQHQGFLYPARESARVDPQVYAAYTGEYELRPNFHLRVTASGDVLTLEPAGQPSMPLVPESETKYYAEAVNIEVTFRKNERGET